MLYNYPLFTRNVSIGQLNVYQLMSDLRWCYQLGPFN